MKTRASTAAIVLAGGGLKSDAAGGQGPADFAINDFVDRGGDLGPHCAAPSVTMP